MSNSKPLCFQVLRTPRNIDFSKKQLSLDNLTSQLNSLLDLKNPNARWTDECSTILQCNPLLLYLFDRFEYKLQRAWGNMEQKVALNPIMIICYHKDCIKKKPVVKLRHAFDLSYYTQHHLSNHADQIGESLRLRFSAVHSDPFISKEDLDALSLSPYSLNPDVAIEDTEECGRRIERLGVCRPLYTNYICHWKSRFIDWGLIETVSLTYQEDEALIYSVLHHPNPVRDWSTWSTIAFYSLKLCTSLSSTALALYRGITRNRLTQNNTETIKEFVRGINHPAPCNNTMINILPKLNYAKERFHTEEILFHMKLMREVESSLKVQYPGIIRYFVTLGIDEQPLNPGTFKVGGILHGLETPMSVRDIAAVGVENLAKHIMSSNKMVTAVREYRCIDFKGLFSSNVYTSFEVGKSASDYGISLDMVAKLVKKCFMCLLDHRECSYIRLDEKCDHCSDNGYDCESLVVFHALWDMDSTQKATADNYDTLDEYSSEDEFMRSDLFTIGFGGLHICKALINPLRNCVLTYNGENFGINILRAYKTHPSLIGVKSNVFAGKDRQCDKTAHNTCDQVIQDSLREINVYHVVRVPERILTYHENCKSQKLILQPVGVACNKNGDIFVLDAGSPCLHTVDRSIVSKVTTYGSNDISAYASRTYKVVEMKLSRSVCSMVISNELLYIVDKLRKEVLIIKASQIKQIKSSKLHLLSVSCSSITPVGVNVALLQEDAILIIKHQKLPSSSSYRLKLEFERIAKITMEHDLMGLFQLPLFDGYFGGWNGSHVSIFQTKRKQVSEIQSNVCSSSVLPSCVKSNMLVITGGNKEQTYSLKKSEETIILTDETATSKFSLTNVVLVHLWGSVKYLIRKAETNMFFLEEIGPLNFGLKYCEDVSRLYDAVAYHPPKVKTIQQLTLPQSIELSSQIVALTQDMQRMKVDDHPSRTCFYHHDGIPYTKTIDCLGSTVNKWGVIVKRLDHIDPSLVNEVNPYAIANEGPVEHGFGHVKTQGQGQNQSMLEYVENKRRNMANFQVRMCKVDFNQIGTSKQQKAYQDVQERKIKIHFRELCMLFASTSSDTTIKQADLTDDEKSMLEKAFAISKSVPRQSGRTVWRQKANYGPNMMVPAETTGILLKGDLVFYRAIDGSLEFYIVQNNFNLLKTQKKVIVTKIGDEGTLNVSPEQFLIDNGMIAAVPSHLYSILEDGTVKFENEDVEELILRLSQEINFQTSNDEGEMEELEEECDIDFNASEGVATTSHASIQNVSGGKKKKKDKKTKKKKKKKKKKKGKKECQEISESLPNVKEFNVTHNDGDDNNDDADANDVNNGSGKRKKRKRVFSDSDDEEDLFDDDTIPTVWKSIIKLVDPSQTDREHLDLLVGKWFACIYVPPPKNSKRKAPPPQLIFGPATPTLFSMERGEHTLQIDCCKPYDLEEKRDTVEEHVKSGYDIWNFKIWDVVAGPLDATFVNDRRWKIKTLSKICDLFDKLKSIDRYNVYMELCS